MAGESTIVVDRVRVVGGGCVALADFGALDVGVIIGATVVALAPGAETLRRRTE